MIYGQPVTFGGGSGEISITENGTFDVKKYATANVNVQPVPVLLWTNASPTSAFAIQTLSLNGSGYSGYIIESRCSSTLSYTSKSFVNIGSPAVAGVMLESLNGLASREVRSSSNSGISFGNGYDSMGYYSDTSCIPVRIWGVEFTI